MTELGQEFILLLLYPVILSTQHVASRGGLGVGHLDRPNHSLPHGSCGLEVVMQLFPLLGSSPLLSSLQPLISGNDCESNDSLFHSLAPEGGQEMQAEASTGHFSGGAITYWADRSLPTFHRPRGDSESRPLRQFILEIVCSSGKGRRKET